MNASMGRVDQAAVDARAVSAGRNAPAALVAALLGAFILLGVGFASPATLHNAAHEARHAFAFPCH